MDIEIFHASFRLALPILLAALGELVVERSGVINIGVEGMMLLGAFFSFWICFETGSPVLGLCAGVLISIFMALLFGLFCVILGCDQIIIGTAVNLFSLGLTGTLFRLFFGFRTTAEVTQAGEPLFAFLFWLLPIALFIFFVRTYGGLALRAAGEAPHALETMGRSVRQIRMSALIFGGGLAGLAGAYLSIVHSNIFIEGMTGGRGFMALAIVIFGRWHPLGVWVAALFFGGALSLQYQIQALSLNIPYQVVRLFPYAVTLLVLALFGQKRGGAPKALGIAHK